MTKKEILFIAYCFEIVLIALNRKYLGKSIREMADEIIEKKDEEDNVQ